MTSQYVLYRYFDSADILLYVGKSGSVGERHSAHVARSQWMQFAARSGFERYGTPEELGDAERVAIVAEHPVFNRQYNDTLEAHERLRAYLRDAGRLDLLPARMRAPRLSGPVVEQDALADATEDDILELLRQILTAASGDHAKVRLWALAVLEGYTDLPRGEELERLADLGSIGRGTAYKTRKMPLPPPRLAVAAS